VFVKGRPCKKCGRTKRYRSNRSCVACTRKNASYMMYNDPDRHLIHQIRYRKRWYERRATPPWVSKNSLMPFYNEAKRLSQQMGIEFEVAHYVPIRGRTVCGLHVKNNLKVASKSWLRIRRFNAKKESEDQMKWLREQGLAR
jgi:hypothetical protein